MPPLHLLQHLPSHVFGELCLQLILFNLANIRVVDSSPHYLERVDVLRLSLLLSELLDVSSDFSPHLRQLLRLLQCLVTDGLREVAKLALLDGDKFVYFIGTRPEISQVRTLRLQPLIESPSCQKFLAADET